MTQKFGKLREEDIPILNEIIVIAKKNGLQFGLHGTSLWNDQYKDVDLLVTSQENNATNFKSFLEEVKEKYSAKIVNERGNEEIGLDCDIKIGRTVLHVSYVVLL